MHRFLVAPELLIQTSPTLSHDALNHLRVIRPKDGEEIELFDGKGSTRLYSFVKTSNSLIAKDKICKSDLVPSQITLFACVTKGSRWDWTIEKATELGVSRIVPVISERTIVRISNEDCEPKRIRWQRIADDAARQSNSLWVPQVLSPVSFDESLLLVKETKCFVGALTTPPSPPLLSSVIEYCEHKDERKPLSLYIGPEGDFTSQELSSLLEVATPTSFGSTILRAETASIFALSILVSVKDTLI